MFLSTIIVNNLIFFLIFSLFVYLSTIKFDLISNFFKIYDAPDKERKFHKKKISLLGSFLFIFALLLCIVYVYLFKGFDLELVKYSVNYKKFFSFFISSFLIFILGFIDDKYNLPAYKKLLFLFIIILVTLNLDQSLVLKELKISFFDNDLHLNKLSIFITIFCFLLFINSFNMFDGINLQSGIYFFQTLIILIYYKFLTNLLLIFLIFNFLFIFLNFKNKAFLGNGGSLLLGYLISYFFIEAYQAKLIIYADFIFLVMMIPGYDLLRLFLERAYNKRHPFSPDRNHIHHLLLNKLGFYYSLFITQFLISIGLILNFFFSISLLISILTGTFFYLIVIIYCRYKN
jgi:UDP-GlcNAc:undecaprenyl-phosphate GlcNAc-1-phosphate transferase